MRIIIARIIGLALLSLLLGLSQGFAEPVLISQDPWGQNEDLQNFTTVFGAGHFGFYSSFTAATSAAIFSPGNRFVMLEGGAGSDADFQAYLDSNQASILDWVSGGGTLLLQSAGWDPGNYGIGPGTLVQDLYRNASNCGTLTSAGQAMLTGTATTQCGEYLAHDYVSGIGLTAFMIGSNTSVPIVAAARYGDGAIIYSGLTDSEWNYAGPGLVDSLIDRSASFSAAAVPEPATLALFIAGLCLLPVVRWLVSSEAGQEEPMRRIKIRLQ